MSARHMTEAERRQMEQYTSVLDEAVAEALTAAKANGVMVHPRVKAIKMPGFFAQLTPEQQKAALEYSGEDC